MQWKGSRIGSWMIRNNSRSESRPGEEAICRIVPGYPYPIGWSRLIEWVGISVVIAEENTLKSKTYRPHTHKREQETTGGHAQCHMPGVIHGDVPMTPTPYASKCECQRREQRLEPLHGHTIQQPAEHAQVQHRQRSRKWTRPPGIDRTCMRSSPA